MRVSNDYHGDGKYLELWDKYLQTIISFVKKGNGKIKLECSEFDAVGNRKKYTFRLDIENGVIPEHKGSAVARDLKAILDASTEFRHCAANKKLVIRLLSNFELEIIVVKITGL